MDGVTRMAFLRCFAALDFAILWSSNTGHRPTGTVTFIDSRVQNSGLCLGFFSYLIACPATLHSNFALPLQDDEF
jgi:hypothetical protein